MLKYKNFKAKMNHKAKIKMKNLHKSLNIGDK